MAVCARLRLSIVWKLSSGIGLVDSLASRILDDRLRDDDPIAAAVFGFVKALSAREEATIQEGHLRLGYFQQGANIPGYHLHFRER